MNWKDILVRAGKTFIQAFFGVFIPALIAILNGGIPESWDAVWVALAPVVTAALAAAISAAWNIIKEWLDKDTE